MQIQYLSRIGIIAIAAVLVGRPWCLQAADYVLERDALRGVRGFSVLVEGLGSAAVDNGLHRDDIKTDVELRLRSLGLPVIDRTPRAPFLYVNINAKCSDVGLCAYSVNLQFNQLVTLPSGDTCHAAIWASGGVGIVGEQKLVTGVRAETMDVADRFANDYLAANPKK